MSFSKEVKEELTGQLSSARHCQLAELGAILSMCGNVVIDEKNHHLIKIHTENLTVARKCFILIKKSFRHSPEISVRRNVGQRNATMYTVLVKDFVVSKKILEATKLMDSQGEIREEMSVTDNLLVQNSCCKRAFLRGAFLVSGSISDPEKAYHFEIVTATRKKAEQIQMVIKSFHIEAKIILRKNYYVVYVKDGSHIVDLLNIMGAHIALMELENVRIVKEMRNSINRQVNCETANINKTVAAASKQMDDIKYVRDTVGLGYLSEALENIARLRLENPDISLKELGQLLDPPIGKSGVNHRMRKISEIADTLRKEKER
ncbi:MAG: DNA-binding protein WhiA [Lachnospiraceae bacterium]|nr:DNA-binding protein WhiA [Lachnospiraceae bacterium]